MRAVVLESYGEVDVLQVQPVPDPVPGHEEVVVEIAATALNRADLLQRRGFYPGPPMPHEILVGDIVILREKRAATYTNAYGRELAEMKWQVTFIDRAVGRKRLYLDGRPSCLFASDARLAYKPQSTPRREQLAKVGTKLP